jgi:hypothetical protein
VDRLKDKQQDIIKRYQEVKRISVVAREFNTTQSLVDKILKQNGVTKRDVIKELNTNEVISLYVETNKVKLVADKFGVSNSVILRLLHANNVRVSKIKYTDEEIIEYYLKVKIIKKVCDDLKISDSKVSKVLKTHNVKLQTLRRKEIGDVYGKLTIIEESNPKVTPSGEKNRQYILKCECGGLVTRSSHHLNKGKTWHCGCVTVERKRKREEGERIKQEERQIKLEIREEKKRNHIPKEKKTHRYVVGSVQGKLTILSITDGTCKTRMVTVQCECGTIKETSMSNMYSIKSCGCLQTINRVKVSTKHGLAGRYDDYQRRWYDRWRGMIKRCYNPKVKSYNNYGGRGITVCDRWREPNGVGCRNYIDDIHNILGPQPSIEHSLDRINNDGPYEITNLRWATNSEQSKNQRRSKSKK